MAGEPYPHFLEDLWLELKDCASRAPLTPVNLRRFFVLMIRAHYSDPANHGPEIDEDLECMVWNPDPNLTGVDIDLAGANKGESRNPQIWVRLGNFQFKRLSFGHKSDDYEPDNATERLILGCSCQLLIGHEGKTIDIAYNMAWSTLCFLLGFHDSIQETLGGEFAGFVPEVLGEPNLLEPSPKDRIRVDVGARLDINISVVTTVESHRLKIVSLTPKSE